METGTRLTVRAYHISSLEYGEENRVTLDGHMTVCPSVAEKIREKEPLIKDISIRIIRPDEHDQHTNTVMDVIPLSAKVLGKVGEGITHTLTGVYVILTGVDEAGRQVCNFGASDGILRDKIAWGRPGTPLESDPPLTWCCGRGPGRTGPVRRRSTEPAMCSARSSGNR